jgi:hypothetical protein
MQEPKPTTTDPKRRYLCRHIFTEGHCCGSPALRGQDLCYYHHASRREPRLAGHNGSFIMPPIDDRPAIQIALYDVLSRLAQFDLDLKRAGMFLYGLQIASSNLGKGERFAATNEPVVEDIVSNPFPRRLGPHRRNPLRSRHPERRAQPAVEGPRYRSHHSNRTNHSTPSVRASFRQPTPASHHVSRRPRRSRSPRSYLEPRTFPQPRTFLGSHLQQPRPNALQWRE